MIFAVGDIVKDKVTGALAEVVSRMGVSGHSYATVRFLDNGTKDVLRSSDLRLVEKRETRD